MRIQNFKREIRKRNHFENKKKWLQNEEIKINIQKEYHQIISPLEHVCVQVFLWNEEFSMSAKCLVNGYNINGSQQKLQTHI